MSIENDIDDLLKQDEAELKAKRKRLRSFGTALDELRRASEKAQAAANELTDRGDLSRADLARVFSFTKGERSALFPAAPRVASTAVADKPSEPEPHPYNATRDTHQDQL